MLFALQDPTTGAEVASGPLAEIFGDMPWIDMVGLGVVLICLILGIRRGLVWQVTRLIGMLLAVTLARTLSPEFVPRFEEVLSLPTKACQGIVWFLVFITTLAITAMIGVVGRRALEAVQLGPMDRMGGAMAGVVTGVIVHCVVLVMLTSLSTPDWATNTLKGSASASMLDNLSRKQHLLLSAEAAERIMGTWGQSYDQAQHELQRVELEEARQQRLDKAADLKKQSEAELKRAEQMHGSGVIR